MTSPAEILAAIAGTAPHVPLGGFPGEARYEFEVTKYELKNTKGGRTIIAADFLVVSCTPIDVIVPAGYTPAPTHKPNDKCGSIWPMSGHRQQWQADQDKGRANAFLRALLHAFLPEDPSKEDIQKALARLIDPKQPARGMRIRGVGKDISRSKCVGVNAAGKAVDKEGKLVESFVEMDWSPVEDQTPATIKVNRDRQDRGELIRVGKVLETGRVSYATSAPVAEVAAAAPSMLDALDFG